MKKFKYTKVLFLLLCVVVFPTKKTFAKSDVKRWRPFPNLNLKQGGESFPISSFAGHPILVLVGKTQEKWYPRMKRDLAEASPFLAKNGVRTVVLLLKGSTVEKDFPWPYFIDASGMFEQKFMQDKARHRLPYFYFVDKRGRVALERLDIHGSILDIPKIVHVYNDFTSGRTPALNIQYGERTKAPDIVLNDLDGVSFKLSSYVGRKAVLVIFFAIDCSFCQKEMPLLAPLGNKPNVVVIGICSAGTVEEIKRFKARHGVAFKILKDSNRSAFMRYKSTTTPESYVIDLDGYISYKHTGTSSDLKNILDFELDKAAGIQSPGRLAGRGYVGSRVCRTCHKKEYNDWLGTPHSVAFSSLVNSGKKNAKKSEEGKKCFKCHVRKEEKKHYEDKECIECHVTGFGKKNGYKNWRETRHLMGVQCEVCHGVGGGHGSADERDKTKEDYKQLCVGCHTQKYSLSFSIDEAYDMMKHSGGEDLSKYSPEVREKIIKRKMGEKRRKSINLGVGYVGNSSCKECHKKEYASWEKTKHAGAYDVLLMARRGEDKKCLKCHTTGYGEANGGFMHQNSTPEMAGVGCEVCHGPGEDHVKAGSGAFKSTIFGLVGKCKYCVIQGMCKTCHNLDGSGCTAADNSPEFNIDTYLPKVTH